MMKTRMHILVVEAEVNPCAKKQQRPFMGYLISTLRSEEQIREFFSPCAEPREAEQGAQKLQSIDLVFLRMTSRSSVQNGKSKVEAAKSRERWTYGWAKGWI